MNRLEIVALSADETQKIALHLAKLLRCGDFLCLNGDLGAGKTTFVQGLAHGLGIGSQITSPTFTLLNEYHDGRLPLVHGDVYRLASGGDLAAIGFDDYRNGDFVIALEWSERVRSLLPNERLEITFSEIENGRRIVFEGYGERWQNFAEEMSSLC